MPVMRGPDGKIIEPEGGGTDSTEETRRIPRRSEPVLRRSEERTQGPTAAEDEPTDAARRARPRLGENAGDSGDSGGDSGGEPESSDEPKTQILRGTRKTSTSRDDDDPAGAADFMDDPVVGWIVVVDGPGRGASLPLGYGMNSIGRSKTERLCLDFGDEQISRNQHAVITYDPRGRKYFVQHGGGKNLTYVSADEPVLMPVELFGGEEVTLGNTRLRFVAFCGKDFDWQDQGDT